MQKAGLVELVDDDRATLLGAFLALADQLRGLGDSGDDTAHLTALWRRPGLRAFDTGNDNGGRLDMTKGRSEIEAS